MDTEELERLRGYQALMAPGTPLREGLDRIVHGRTGALIVLGESPDLFDMSTGGFLIDVPFTATGLRELAKMDGAIILGNGLGRIIRAGVHLMPDAAVPTDETGTRHRTADRVSRQTGLPVVAVSASMSTIALYLAGRRHVVERPEQLLTRANQALATLTGYRERLWEAAATLSALEVHDQVTVADVTHVARRLEMFRRLEVEIDAYVAELGVEGRLVQLQLHELGAGLEELPQLLQQDYRSAAGSFQLAALSACSDSELLVPEIVAQVVGFGPQVPLSTRIRARGYRQLAAVPRLPRGLAARLIDHFGGLQELFGASAMDLLTVDGVDEGLARLVRDGLVWLAEAAYGDRD